MVEGSKVKGCSNDFIKNLYGLPETPDKIAKAFLRLDNNKWSYAGSPRKGDKEMCDEYIRTRCEQIRKRKMELGIERFGVCEKNRINDRRIEISNVIGCAIRREMRGFACDPN